MRSEKMHMVLIEVSIFVFPNKVMIHADNLYYLIKMVVELEVTFTIFHNILSMLRNSLHVLVYKGLRN